MNTIIFSCFRAVLPRKTTYDTIGKLIRIKMLYYVIKEKDVEICVFHRKTTIEHSVPEISGEFVFL